MLNQNMTIYANLAEDGGRSVEYGLDPERVKLILFALFEDGRVTALQVSETQGCYLVIVNDYPFFVAPRWAWSGRAVSAERVIRYYREGTLQSAPLRPRGSPVEAASSLVKSKEWRELFDSKHADPGREEGAKSAVYDQAERSLLKECQ